MCVIIVKQKEQEISKEIAKTSARLNPHGLGIVWLDTEVRTTDDERNNQRLGRR